MARTRGRRVGRGQVVFNAGRQAGPVPAHVTLNQQAGTARWTSAEGRVEVDITR
jgi:hypothetical protein